MCILTTSYCSILFKNYRSFFYEPIVFYWVYSFCQTHINGRRMKWSVGATGSCNNTISPIHWTSSKNSSRWMVQICVYCRWRSFRDEPRSGGDQLFRELQLWTQCQLIIFVRIYGTKVNLILLLNVVWCWGYKIKSKSNAEILTWFVYPSCNVCFNCSLSLSVSLSVLSSKVNR